MARPHIAKELKVLKGTFQKCREKENPVKPKGTPEPPAWLTEEAVAEWERVTKGYEGLGIYTSVDRAVLATYCDLWSKYVTHAKAGELADHFAEFFLVEGNRIVDKVKTYRGEGIKLP